MLVRRRGLLAGVVGLATIACARPAPRPSATAPPRGAEFDAWRQEAQGMLSDVLQSLRTFDGFHAFRVSTAADSSGRSGAELAWDPPTGAAWDDATHVARGLHGRAEQLFLAVTGGEVDASLWREHRELADATHDLLDLAEALTTYRDRVDRLPPGDTSGALGLLEQAWAQWEKTAARWGVSRSEAIGCAS